MLGNSTNKKKCGLSFNKSRVPFKVTIVCAWLNAYALYLLYSTFLKKSTPFSKISKIESTLSKKLFSRFPHSFLLLVPAR